MSRRTSTNVVPFPSPATVLRTNAPLRWGYVWKHDLQSIEFRGVSSEARCLYLALLVVVDSDTQSATIGKTTLGKLAGIDRANVRRSHLQLQAAGLLRVTTHAITGGKKIAYERHTYTLLCPPSTLRVDPRQQPLPFRRFSYGDFNELRSHGL